MEEWRNAIAKPAGDHLMSRFVISTALSGTLLYLGGFGPGDHSFEGGGGGGDKFNRQDDTTQDGGVYVGFEADNGFCEKVEGLERRPGGDAIVI